MVDLKSTVATQWRYVTQIIHMIGWEKRTFEGIDTKTIKQGEFTKCKTKDGRLLMINTKNVLLVEVFPEKTDENTVDIVHKFNLKPELYPEMINTSFIT